jgi:hypothetical protein
VDLFRKCLKGADAGVFVSTNTSGVRFIGNGWLMHDRDEIFKNAENLKS